MAAAQTDQAPEILSELYSRRAVKLLASIRLLIALSTSILFAVTDRISPGSAPVYALLLWYLGFSALVFALSRTRPTLGVGWSLASHANDLIAFAALMMLTDGPLSPFFLFLILGVLGATIQWGWTGAVTTTAAVVIIYCGAILVADSATTDLRRILLRTLYLGASSGLLVYLGLRLQRLHRDVVKLAFRPRGEKFLEPEEAVRQASHIFEQADIILLFSEAGRVTEISCRGGAIAKRSFALDSIVHSDLESRDFLIKGPAGGEGDSTVLFWERSRLRHWKGRAIAPELASLRGSRDALCVRVRSVSKPGRLLVLGLPDATTDDLAIAAVLGTETGLLLDRREMLTQASRAAALEERMRLARDLHDGILQVFTSLGLQIERALREIDEPSHPATNWLRRVQCNIEMEQAEFRRYVQQLRDLEAFAPLPLGSELKQMFAELEPRLNRRWGLQVSASVEAGLERIAPATVYQLFSLISEAAANAAKHGRASHLDCRLEMEGSAMRLRIRDDGQGWSADLMPGNPKSKSPYPRSLRDRVEAMGGALSIRSDEAGTELLITLPRSEGAAENDNKPGAGR